MKIKLWFVLILCVWFSPIVPGEEPASKSQKATPGEEAEKAKLSEIDRLKNPVPWLKWGYDLRLREIYAKNFLWMDNDSAAPLPENEWHWQRFRSRIWADFTVNENVKIETRLVWEPRNYCKPNNDYRRGPFEWDEALFDKLNVTFKNAFDAPLDIKLGRQEIIFGNGWLVLDGTPSDGSRTIFFDAARFTYHLNKDNDVDMIYIDQRGQSDEYIEPFNDQEHRVNDLWGRSDLNALSEQDERGAILYFTNKSLVPKGKLEGYYIWKHDQPIDRDPRGRSNDGHYHTLGARVSGDMDDHWQYRAEFAQQVGQKNFDDLCAFGFNGRMTYQVKDQWNSSFYGGYEYLSGDDPDTKTNEQFDQLWARWPRWSELIIYTYATETRIAECVNLHRISMGWTADPCKKIKLSSEYDLLFADENTREGSVGYDNNSKFRGQLLVTKLVYKFTPQISGHLLGEYFFPGNYYTDDDRNDAAAFLRYELTFTF